jgi:hypothetical protein
MDKRYRAAGFSTALRIAAGLACGTVILATSAQAYAASVSDEPRAKGKKTEIVKDSLKKTTNDVGETVYEQTIEIKNKSNAEITVNVTSHPWSKPDKWKREKDKDGNSSVVVGPDGRLVPADPIPGRFGQRKESRQRIAAGETKTITFMWAEQFKFRYTDVYVEKTLDAGTFQEFDVSSLSPFDRFRIPADGTGAYALEQIFPYPYAVFAEFAGVPVDFVIEPDIAVLPPGWSVDFLNPALGDPFTLAIAQESLDLDVALNLDVPELPGQEALISYYVVQTDLDYRYHVVARVSVVGAPATVAMLVPGLIFLYRLRRRTLR